MMISDRTVCITRCSLNDNGGAGCISNSYAHRQTLWTAGLRRAIASLRWLVRSGKQASAAQDGGWRCDADGNPMRSADR